MAARPRYCTNVSYFCPVAGERISELGWEEDAVDVFCGRFQPSRTFFLLPDRGDLAQRTPDAHGYFTDS